mmetsp:Transcript_19473/g.27316  ORF Transcript_19473/g.27316 Transcript_19473/m.27316 type:complete len:131 (+) Transcript_19473:79-471(+)
MAEIQPEETARAETSASNDSASTSSTVTTGRRNNLQRFVVEPPQRGLTITEGYQLDSWQKEEMHRNEQYLRNHPEIANMIKAFVCRVLTEKPEDVIEFAVEHFVADKHQAHNRYQVTEDPILEDVEDEEA